MKNDENLLRSENWKIDLRKSVLKRSTENVFFELKYRKNQNLIEKWTKIVLSSIFFFFNIIIVIFGEINKSIVFWKYVHKSG